MKTFFLENDNIIELRNKKIVLVEKLFLMCQS